MPLPPKTTAFLGLQALAKPIKRPVRRLKATWLNIIMKDIEIYSNFQIKNNHLEDIN